MIIAGEQPENYISGRVGFVALPLLHKMLS